MDFGPSWQESIKRCCEGGCSTVQYVASAGAALTSWHTIRPSVTDVHRKSKRRLLDAQNGLGMMGHDGHPFVASLSKAPGGQISTPAREQKGGHGSTYLPATPTKLCFHPRQRQRLTGMTALGLGTSGRDPQWPCELPTDSYIYWLSVNWSGSNLLAFPPAAGGTTVGRGGEAAAF